MKSISSDPRQLPEGSATTAWLRWFLQPRVQLTISIIFSGIAQLFLKLGSAVVSEKAWFGIGALASGWTWIGILAMIASLLSWLYALRFIPLNVAFNLAGAVQVLVPLMSWIFLGESIIPIRWAGILLVLAGVVVIAKPTGEVEEKL